MRILVMALVFFAFFSGAQAQYLELVETKIDHLNQLAASVDNAVGLSSLDKDWALQHIVQSKTLLIEASEQDLSALQAAEIKINETSKKIAGRLLMTKKVKLMSRITALEAMIDQYQAEGLDTKPLETLQEAMKLHLENLGL